MLDINSHLHSLDLKELAIRLTLAAICGLVIGLDRSFKKKPMGFRPYIIVAVTTCMLALIGLELPHLFAETAPNHVTLDVGKIIAGALTGIGFLGAGAIMRRSNEEIVGTVTGASIWGAGALGLTIGFGLYVLAGITFGILMLSLFCIYCVKSFK